MEFFAPSARALIARATRLAQQQRDTEVQLRHLVLSASEDGLQDPVMAPYLSAFHQCQALLLQAERDSEEAGEGVAPEFSSETLDVFQVAYRTFGPGEPLEEAHLLASIPCSRVAGAVTPPTVMLSQLLSPDILEGLARSGVDTAALVNVARSIPVANVTSWDPDFWSGEKGKQIQALSRNAATHSDGGIYGFLLAFVAPNTPWAAQLRATGLTEPVLTELLQRLAGPSPAARERFEHYLRSSASLELVPEIQEEHSRLHPEVRVALALAYDLAERTPVEPGQLLYALVISEHLGAREGGSTRLLQELGALPAIVAQTFVSLFETREDTAALRLTPQVVRALQHAFRSASETVTTTHVLLGLAMLGPDFPEMLDWKITPEAVLEHWRE